MRLPLAALTLVTAAACAAPAQPRRVADEATPALPPAPATLAPPTAAPATPAPRTAAPTTFRPRVEDVEVLVDGDTLVLPMRDYRGPRSRAPVPSTAAALRGFGVDLADDQWVLADGAAPCLAHPSAVVLDVAEPVACSAVDCDLDFARVTLAGCGPGSVAIAGRPDGATPTWRYVAATTIGGSDLIREDRATAAYQRKLARYHHARRRDAVRDPGFVHRARPRTALPERYRAMAPRCGERCALTWSVHRLPITPALEALTLERATGAGEALCALTFDTEIRLFAVSPTGPVALADGAQPALVQLAGGFRGALVEGEVVQMTLPAPEPAHGDCESVDH